MADEKKGSSEDRRSDVAENAATAYGLEDHEATAQDPRVTELQQSRSQQHRRSLQTAPKITTTPRLLSRTPSHDNVSKSITRPNVNYHNTNVQDDQKINQKDPPVAVIRSVRHQMLPTTAEPKTGSLENPPSESQRSTVPVTSGVHSKLSNEAEVVSQTAKPNLASKSANTDITFDPSKEYASKTTNTSCLLYTENNEETPESFNLDDCFAFAVALVRKAGAVALDSNKAGVSYTTKEHEKDLNTRTDTEVEEMITKAILDKYPDHKIIAEEAVSESETGQVNLANNPTWIIDPIDGTMNYVHHFPYYCIALAFLIDKQTEFGIVFNPPLQQFYTARKGKGAELNEQPMNTSGQDSLKKAMVLQEYSSGMIEARAETSMENAKTLIRKTHALRSIGSSAMGLAMVASGVADAFYFFGLHVWDMAAGNILVTEAGGTVIDPAGGVVDIMSRRVLAAATKPLALELSGQLQQNYPSPRDDEPRKGADPLRKDFQAQTEFSDSSLSLESDSSMDPTTAKTK